MSKTLRIGIWGDLFMKPEAFEVAVVRELAKSGHLADFRSEQFPYPIDEFELPDRGTPSARGIGWDDIAHSPNDEVSEYYGRPEDFVGRITDEDILIVHMAPVTRAALACATSLKLIASCRGGPENVNVAAAAELGIPVVNAPGRNAVPVAEFTVGLLLAHIRYISRGHASLARGVWKVGAYRSENAGPQVRGSTVGIVGLGNVGQETARLLAGFGVTIVAYDPYVDDSVLQALWVERVSLDELLHRSDFVIVSARLTRETSGMIGARELGLMKSSAYLVNAARAALVDYDALRVSLRDGRIAGAALDVFDVEPPMRDDPLLGLPNVTVTPHIAAASTGVLLKTADIVAGEVGRYARGERLCHCVNAKTLKCGAALDGGRVG